MHRIGGITQLVEWLLCKQHVAGSNPTTSTNCQFSTSRFAYRIDFVDAVLLFNQTVFCRFEGMPI